MFGKKKYTQDIIMNEIKREIPNCALCQWSDKGKYDGSYCGAQAMRLQKEVYDSDNCKELFKVDILKRKKIVDEIEKEIPEYQNHNQGKERRQKLIDTLNENLTQDILKRMEEY